MSYRVDNTPLELLERRIVYYKKVRGRMRKLDTLPYFQKYSKKQLKEMKEAVLENIDRKIHAFNIAACVIHMANIDYKAWGSRVAR